jgi:RNA polymerase sigma-70 factor, ECF subfamily
LQRQAGGHTLMSMGSPALDAARSSCTALPDSEIVQRVRAGERALFEVLMRRYNQRVYRITRAIVKDEAEAEDVMQQAYINAFVHLPQFEERAQFSTWLTRIAVNEAIARRNKLRVAHGMKHQGDVHADLAIESIRSGEPDPEHQAYIHELHCVLEDAVDTLPEAYRAVFVLRDIEGMTTAETGQGLGIGEEAVKTRLHRARAMIRRAVSARIGATATQAFQFQAPRCDRIVAAVLERLSI